MSELDSQGQKSRTYVYVGGAKVAWQTYWNGQPKVLWEHRDPSGASFRQTDVTGGIFGYDNAEVDPAGGNVEFSNPYVDPNPPPNGESSFYDLTVLHNSHVVPPGTPANRCDLSKRKRTPRVTACGRFVGVLRFVKRLREIDYLTGKSLP